MDKSGGDKTQVHVFLLSSLNEGFVFSRTVNIDATTTVWQFLLALQDKVKIPAELLKIYVDGRRVGKRTTHANEVLLHKIGMAKCVFVFANEPAAWTRPPDLMLPCMSTPEQTVAHTDIKEAEMQEMQLAAQQQSDKAPPPDRVVISLKSHMKTVHYFVHSTSKRVEEAQNILALLTNALPDFIYEFQAVVEAKVSKIREIFSDFESWFQNKEPQTVDLLNRFHKLLAELAQTELDAPMQSYLSNHTNLAILKYQRELLNLSPEERAQPVTTLRDAALLDAAVSLHSAIEKEHAKVVQEYAQLRIIYNQVSHANAVAPIVGPSNEDLDARDQLRSLITELKGIEGSNNSIYEAWSQDVERCSTAIRVLTQQTVPQFVTTWGDVINAHNGAIVLLREGRAKASRLIHDACVIRNAAVARAVEQIRAMNATLNEWKNFAKISKKFCKLGISHIDGLQKLHSFGALQQNYPKLREELDRRTVWRARLNEELLKSKNFYEEFLGNETRRREDFRRHHLLPSVFVDIIFETPMRLIEFKLSEFDFKSKKFERYSPVASLVASASPAVPPDLIASTSSSGSNQTADSTAKLAALEDKITKLTQELQAAEKKHESEMRQQAVQLADTEAAKLSLEIRVQELESNTSTSKLTLENQAVELQRHLDAERVARQELQARVQSLELAAKAAKAEEEKNTLSLQKRIAELENSLQMATQREAAASSQLAAERVEKKSLEDQVHSLTLDLMKEKKVTEELQQELRQQELFSGTVQEDYIQQQAKIEQLQEEISRLQHVNMTASSPLADSSRFVVVFDEVAPGNVVACAPDINGYRVVFTEPSKVFIVDGSDDFVQKVMDKRRFFFALVDSVTLTARAANGVEMYKVQVTPMESEN